MVGAGRCIADSQWTLAETIVMSGCATCSSCMTACRQGTATAGLKHAEGPSVRLIDGGESGGRPFGFPVGRHVSLAVPDARIDGGIAAGGGNTGSHARWRQPLPPPLGGGEIRQRSPHARGGGPSRGGAARGGGSGVRRRLDASAPTSMPHIRPMGSQSPRRPVTLPTTTPMAMPKNMPHIMTSFLRSIRTARLRVHG
jgi:hypothetical protein